MPARNDWIDLLRTLSAVGVAMFHFTLLYALQPGTVAGAWHHFWEHGYLGVPVFLVLSGYCLVPGWLRSPGAGMFLRHRLWRLLPPYWASLLLVVVIALAVKLRTGTNDVAPLPHDFPSVLAHLLMLTQPLTAVPRLNWASWTLIPLLGFSCLLGLLRLPPARFRLSVLVGLHVLLCAADLLLRPPDYGWLLFLHYWPMFGIGIALAALAVQPAAGRVMLAASVVHFLGCLALGHDDKHYIQAAFLTAVILRLTRGLALPGWLQPVARLGRLTYSLYLMHVPVGVYLLYRLLPAEPAGAPGLIGGQLFLLAGSLAAAALFFLACEKPLAAGRAAA